jgi:hypothetical protein
MSVVTVDGKPPDDKQTKTPFTDNFVSVITHSVVDQIHLENALKISKNQGFQDIQLMFCHV